MGWYNSSWTYRQKITVDATKVDEVFSLLPIYTSRLNLDFFDNAKAGAADIRITQSDGTTEIARYVVAHDATAHTGLILANVLADVSISTDTDYYVYYGNAAASDHATSATYGRDAVFSEYEGAYMPGMTLSDLTGAGRDLTAVATPTTAASTYEGITAAVYNGTTQGHYHTGVAVTNWPMTIEALAYIANTTSNRPAVALVSTASNSPQAYVGFAQTADKISMTVNGDSGSTSTAETSTTYVANTYYHMMGTRDANTGTSTAYKNGGSSGTESTTITTPTFNTTSIGYLKLATPSTFLAGRVAVALLSNSVRSADYSNTMYNAWSTSGFFTAGAIETETGGTTGWVIANAGSSVSDGWTAWTNPTRVTADDASYATCAPPELDSTDWLRATFDLSALIPSGATINGVKARFQASRGSSGPREVQVYLVVGGTQVGSNKSAGAILTGTPTNYDRGGAADLWGTSITQAQAVATDFGFQIEFGDDDSGSDTVSVDAMWINVHFTTGGNTGTGAITLGAATVSGTGTEREDGSGTPALGNVEVSGAGTQSLTGSGAITLGALGVDGVSSGALNGTGDIMLGAISTSGAGTQSFSGSGAISLGAVSVSGSEIAEETTGWFLFQYAESDNSGEWDQPSFALSDDSSYASRPFTLLGGESGYLIIKQPSGIDIPDDAQITSIQYKIKRWVDGYLPSDKVFDLLIRPIKDGVPSGDNIAKVGAWPTSAETVEYNEDLMGLTWESNDFGSNFGLAISVLALGPTTVSANVVTVWGKINYTVPEPITGVGAIELGSISVGGGGDSNLLGYGSITLGNVEAKAAGNSDFCQCCIGYTMSTLLEIRKRLARESGHYELVADYDSGDYADNGMDEYIRGGARYLDDKFQYDKSEAWFYKKLVEGESLVTFQNNRIIKSVWVNQASGDRKKLKRLTLDEIREQYTKDTLAGETNGVPAYWTPAILGLAPEQYTEDAASFALEGLTDYDLIMFGNHYPHKGIYVMPPCDDTYTVEVLAEWYSAELCDDEDVSFWSQYPEILCMAARREIEIHLHRNTTGAADFERPILEKLLDLYRNLIAEEVSGPPEDLVMNG